tara:strand:- start:228 stop:896 length:669 start_codon:yes stop_codon:yes gene_type:complete
MNKINSIKKACKITDQIFTQIVNNLKQNKFKTEQDIYNFILKEIKKRQLRPSFLPLVVNNNSKIHPKPRKYKLKQGFLVLDFGVRVNGYCSDMTRTLYLGKPTKYHKKFYNLLLKTQKYAINKAKIGMFAKQLDILTINKLKHYSKYFTHGLGHGLGKRIHTKPSLKLNSTDILKKGDIFTIEPGIYIKNKKIGLRIEDVIYLGKTKQILSKSKKTLITINI